MGTLRVLSSFFRTTSLVNGISSFFTTDKLQTKYVLYMTYHQYALTTKVYEIFILSLGQFYNLALLQINLKKNFEKLTSYEGLDGGVWNSLISKNLALYSLSLKFLLIL